MYGIEQTHIKKTYPQNWRAYNAAQTSEKAKFLELLHALCGGIEEPSQTNGRPRLPIGDAIFSVCYKIFSTVSGRRFISDLRDAQVKGYIERTPHFNSIFNYLDNPALTSILQGMIVESSLPLTAVEEDFAADSSGFTSSVYTRWAGHKYGKSPAKDWCKAHIMCGVKTNIVTAVEIRTRSAHDAPIFPELLETTAENFRISEVSADKGYAALYNYNAVDALGAVPFIPFKKNMKPGSGVWGKMYHYFHYRNDEFRAHYHKRSNVETVFSMIKAKFGSHVRSKTETAMRNEVLCKILCHNICVLIQEMHELGIEVDFKEKRLMN